MTQPGKVIFCRFDDPVSVERAARPEPEGGPGWHTVAAAAGLVAFVVYTIRRKHRGV